jgi:thioredoxin-dependent peroxiredoxin
LAHVHGEKRQKKGIFPMVETGAMAPDFTLSDADDKSVALASFKGRPVVVYFYPKDDTPGCTTEAKDFTCLAGEFAEAGALVLGISPDAPAKHRAFKEKYELGVQLLSDTTHVTAEAYGVWAEKSMYGRKYMGIERSTFLIDASGRIAQSWRMVKVPGHADAVLEAVRALKP